MRMEKTMKTIASFGEFVRATWLVWTAVFATVVVLLINTYAVPTVTLDSKHWSCTMAVPDGIGSRCIEYVAKEKIK